MHVRWSSCRGLPVIESGAPDVVASLQQPVIHPDTGMIEGFYVDLPGWVLPSPSLFLSRHDIVRWGTSVMIRDTDMLGPVEDRVRLQPLLDDPRTVLGQRLQYENGTSIGVLKDIQFNTESFSLEWLFPKKFFLWGRAIARREIREITEKAVIIRNPVRGVEQEVTTESASLDDVTDLAETALPPKPVTRHV